MGSSRVVERLYSQYALYYVDARRELKAGTDEQPDKYVLRAMRLPDGWDPRDPVAFFAFPRMQGWAVPIRSKEQEGIPKEGYWIWLPRSDVEEGPWRSFPRFPLYQFARTFRASVPAQVRQWLSAAPRFGPETLVGSADSGQCLKVRVLDVGQGDSILIRFENGTTWLVDAFDDDVRSRVLADQLETLGVRTIDRAFLTHPHADHMSGFATLIERGMVNEICVADNLGHEAGSYWLLSATEKRIPVRVIPNGFSSLFSGIRFSARCHTRQYADRNRRSVVSLLEHGSAAVILSGDITNAGPDIRMMKSHTMVPAGLRTACFSPAGPKRPRCYQLALDFLIMDTQRWKRSQPVTRPRCSTEPMPAARLR